MATPWIWLYFLIGLPVAAGVAFGLGVFLENLFLAWEFNLFSS